VRIFSLKDTFPNVQFLEYLTRMNFTYTDQQTLDRSFGLSVSIFDPVSMSLSG